MKILITTDWYTPAVNGVVTSVKNLQRELEHRGHEVRILTLSYLGMFLISLCNPGEFCPFPNAALMVMLFAQAEEAVGDVAVPVRQLLARHLGAPAGFLQF